MRRKISFMAFILSVFFTQAQYKNDNVLYRTLDWADLCTQLQSGTDYLLLDVRTPAEFNDTSDYINAGHIKGAKNIGSQEIARRLAEISSYKDKPVFVYCSHSQRSRRVSKLLADSGFTHIYNINGGITALYYSNAKDEPCLQQLITTKNTYAIISAADLCYKLANKQKDLVVLDVRTDAAFRHITAEAAVNAIGTIRGSVNIPLDDLEKKGTTIAPDKEIIVVDISGQEAARAARLLKQRGFEKVSMLIEGIGRLLSEDNSDAACLSRNYISPVKYTLINSVAFADQALKDKKVVLLDVRPAVEFNNNSKDAWRNIGHIRYATNIPASELSTRIKEIGGDPNRPVLLYDFSGDEAVFSAADILTRHGFTHVQVLMGGLFNIRWTAANRNLPYLKDIVADVPAENQ